MKNNLLIDKRGGFTDLFIFMIFAFVIVFNFCCYGLYWSDNRKSITRKFKQDGSS